MALAADIIDGKVSAEQVPADEAVPAGTVTVQGKVKASDVRVHVATGRAVRVVSASAGVEYLLITLR